MVFYNQMCKLRKYISQKDGKMSKFCQESKVTCNSFREESFTDCFKAILLKHKCPTNSYVSNLSWEVI